MVQSLYKRDYYDADSHLATGGPSLLWRQNGMNHVQVHIRIRGESNHGLLGARWGIKRRPNKVDPGNRQKPGQGNTSVWLKCVIIAGFQIMVNCREPHHHHPEEQNQNWHLRKPRALQSCLWTEILDGRPWIQWTFWSSVHLGKK